MHPKAYLHSHQQLEEVLAWPAVAAAVAGAGVVAVAADTNIVSLAALHIMDLGI